MSTHSRINIKVDPKDYQRVNEITGYNISEDKPYISIYCHHDGYPEHMFEELNNNWNDYERALDLVLAGDTSAVHNGNTDSYAKYETYEDVKPELSSDPVNSLEYNYLFIDNKWKMI